MPTAAPVLTPDFCTVVVAAVVVVVAGGAVTYTVTGLYCGT